MPSERVRRKVESLLDEAEAALTSHDWSLARTRAQSALALDPRNSDALHYLEAAERGQSTFATPAKHEAAVPAAAHKSDAHLSAAPVPPAPASPSYPSSFSSGRYVVKRFLGEGGKKRVFLAHDTTLDRDVAFALIKTEGLDEAARTRVTREAQAMGRLGAHPNIVTVFDLGHEPVASPLPAGESQREGDGEARKAQTQPFMVTELMGGGDVEKLIEKAPEHRPALEKTVQVAREVCEGLVFAHSRGIVHRDLKPGNVWLTERGVAKIGDFGLAVATDRSRLTREGMMVGTVSYMPPEQAMGGEVTPRADLYSLGAMLYEMVTGRPPFLGDDDIAVIGQHINTPPVAPSWHNPSCPKPLDALIMRLLAKDPKQRPESAKDVLAALEGVDASAAVRPEPVEGRGGDGAPALRQAQGAQAARSLDSVSSGVFVGRQKEMDQLRAALEETLSGRGRMVTLVGEPGIGKTRTAQELQTYAGLRRAQVLWGRCYEGGGAPPYWPWVQAIRQYVRERDPDGLRREMGSTASVIAEVVSDVKERIPGVQAPPQLDSPESARFRLFDSIATFLKSASLTQPLVVVLDDLHWSDKPSLLLLEFVAKEIPNSRVLLMGTYRDVELNRKHPLAVTLGDLTKERLYERVLLRGLQKHDIERFIEIASGVKPPAGLTDAVHTQTEGNPLFVTEVVRWLVQEGALTREKVSDKKSWSMPIPEGVRDVIGKRLDRLSPRCNDVLTTASVIGRRFALAALVRLYSGEALGQRGSAQPGPAAERPTPLPSEGEGLGEGVKRGGGAPPNEQPGQRGPAHPEPVEGRSAGAQPGQRGPAHPEPVEGRSTGGDSLSNPVIPPLPAEERLSEDRLLEALEEALAARVIEELPSGPGRYQFTHALIQETLAKELSTTRKVRLHARIGLVLEDLYRDRLEDHAAELAEHFAEAETVLGTDRLVKYCLIAGEKARRNIAFEEALPLYSRALEACGSAPMDEAKARILAGLAAVEGALADESAAFEHLKAAFDYYVSTGDFEKATELASRRFLNAKWSEMTALAEKALTLVVPGTVDEARVLVNLGVSAGLGSGTTRYKESIDALDRATRIARQIGDASLEFRALADRGMVESWGADMASAYRTVGEAAKTMARANDPLNESMVSVTLGMQCSERGLLDAALEWYRRGSAAAVASGVRERMATVCGLRQIHHLRRGEWQKVAELRQEAREYWPDDPVTWAHSMLAEFEQGNYDVGHRLLETRPGTHHPYGYASYAFRAWQLSGQDRLRDQAAQLLAFDAENPLDCHGKTLCNSVGAGWGAIASRNSAAALDYVDRIEKHVPNVGFGLFTAPWHLSDMCGHLLRLAGLRARAAEHFEHALSSARNAKYGASVAWMAHDYSELLLEPTASKSDEDRAADTDRAAKLRDEALSIARELGMKPLIERILRRREILKA